MQWGTGFRYGGKKINPSLKYIISDLEIIIIPQWHLRANSECFL